MDAYQAIIGKRDRRAYDSRPIPEDVRHRIRQDEIVLHLQAEEWVETATAKVVAVVQTVLSGDQAGRQGSRVPAVLSELVPGATWHIVSFDRSPRLASWRPVLDFSRSMLICPNWAKAAWIGGGERKDGPPGICESAVIGR